ncbi:MAG: DUF4843 domain-containing protein [Bacteroidota bacterium]
MKKIKYSSAILLVVVTCFLSCKKEDIPTYSGNTAIYFTNNYRNNVDSGMLTFSYSLSSVKDSVFSIPVSIMGMAADVDRAVKVVVLDSSTARAGVHYELLSQTFAIRKGKLADTLKIKLLRTADIQNAAVSLILQLKPNDYFTTDMQSVVTNSVTGSSFSFLKYRLMVNDILSKPKYWGTSTMGNFSRKKVYLTASVLNLQLTNMFDILLNNTNSQSLPAQTYWGRSMQIYLNQQKAAGTPVYDEDGSLMIMGSSVQ